jgi:antitoxin VapB
MCCRRSFDRGVEAPFVLRAVLPLTRINSPCDFWCAQCCRVHRIPSQRSVTMADAPPRGSDGGACNFDLPEVLSEIFLIPGLDIISENQKMICPSGSHSSQGGLASTSARLVYRTCVMVELLYTSTMQGFRAMHLNIKNDEAHKLATELAKLTGENLTSAVTLALRERLARERRRRNADTIAARLMKIGSRYAALPDTGRSPDEILGYDEHGLPT